MPRVLSREEQLLLDSSSPGLQRTQSVDSDALQKCQVDNHVIVSHWRLLNGKPICNAHYRERQRLKYG